MIQVKTSLYVTAKLKTSFKKSMSENITQFFYVRMKTSPWDIATFTRTNTRGFVGRSLVLIPPPRNVAQRSKKESWEDKCEKIIFIHGVTLTLYAAIDFAARVSVDKCEKK